MKNKVMIVAELSANHNQNKQVAIDTLIAAKEAGADAIKLQTYTPETMTIDCDEDCFKIGGGTLWDGKTLYDLYREAYTPWEWHRELFDLASSLDMLCFSTPFDNTAVDFLEQLGNPVYKIASFEITDIPLIRYIARLLKPVIISSGIATLADIEHAIHACKEEGNNDITLLKCTSAYPASLDEANLLTIPVLKERFNVKVGLSDHTSGDIAPVVAASLGAELIEKHFILDRNLGGADAAFSMEPSEFKTMVMRIRDVERALGSGVYEVSKGAASGRKFSRSLFVVADIKKGDTFTGLNIRSIRPGDGLPPEKINEIIGKKARMDIKRGTPLSEEMIS